MTVLLQNRTISMILTVPDVEVSTPSSSPIIEKLDRSDIDQSFSIVNQDQQSNIDTNSSMPVYHGSIVRIEQHNDDQNASDLIVRVPNFQRLTLPSNDIDTKQQTRIKRRAPICPIINGSNLSNNPDSSNSNLNQSRVTSTNRLTTGLRSLSRAFTYGCKSKRSSSINEIKYPPALPDVEVMTAKLQIPTSSQKNSKHGNSTSIMPKLMTPKILFIKRKHWQMKKKQSSSSSSGISNSTQIDHRIHFTPNPTILTTQYTDTNQINSLTYLPRFIEENDLTQETNTIEDDEDKEQQNESIGLTYEVEQHFAAISQLISDNPVSSIDADSLSTHRYSTISAVIPETDNQSEDISSKSSLKTNRPFRVQTSLLQPDISVIRMGTTDLTTGVDRLLPGEKFSNEQFNFQSNTKQIDDNHIEQGWYGVIHPNDETFAECYEVTYQIDPSYQNKKEQISNQSTIPFKINLDPYEYKNLTSKCLPYRTENQYEQIKHEKNIHHNEQEILPRIKSRSVDDLSRTSNEHQSESNSSSSSSSETSSRHCILQRSNSYNGFGVYVSTDVGTHREHFIRQVEQLSPGDQAGLKENDRILCINGTPVINEDYTVVLQLINHGLQTDTLDFHVITNDAYEEFKREIDQLYQ